MSPFTIVLLLETKASPHFCVAPRALFCLPTSHVNGNIETQSLVQNRCVYPPLQIVPSRSLSQNVVVLTKRDKLGELRTINGVLSFNVGYAEDMPNTIFESNSRNGLGIK
jgi:hypothetical protein